MSMSKRQWIDQPSTIREGESIDLEKLSTFLRSHLPSAKGEITIKQFPGGFSNLTYAITVGEQEFVLRKPPFGANIKSGHDMGREYKILAALDSAGYKKVPRPIVYEEENTVLGAPFYLMERVQGVILRYVMPKEMYPNKDAMSAIASSWLDTFVELHALDIQEINLEDLGKPDGYTKRQIDGWGRRYFKAKTDEIPKLEQALKWLEKEQPKTSNVALIHNDFKYDNLVLDPNDWTNVLAILDWEMATIGDSLMDLGTSIGYWVNTNDPDFMRQMKLSPTHLPGNPKRGEIVHQYALRSGREIQNPVFLYVYGLFKIAVIVQQIYARYKQGHTKDPRFATLIEGVKAIGEISSQAIERNKIDDLF